MSNLPRRKSFRTVNIAYLAVLALLSVIVPLNGGGAGFSIVGLCVLVAFDIAWMWYDNLNTSQQLLVAVAFVGVGAAATSLVLIQNIQIGEVPPWFGILGIVLVLILAAVAGRVIYTTKKNQI